MSVWRFVSEIWVLPLSLSIITHGHHSLFCESLYMYYMEFSFLKSFLSLLQELNVCVLLLMDGFSCANSIRFIALCPHFSPFSFIQRIRPGPRPFVTFRNKIIMV
jgi:hypothetical protein